MKILLLSCGGTINKYYDEITGDLPVDGSDFVAQKLTWSAKANIDFEIRIVGAKDSLEMDDGDRKKLADEVASSGCKKIIILHGTDTMDKTAAYLAKKIKDKKVILVGSMSPYRFAPEEAVFNFACAVGFLRAKPKDGVYISMHSLVSEHDAIYKDRVAGAFKSLK